MIVTREELHGLIDRPAPDELVRAARALQAILAEHQSAMPWSRSLGMVECAGLKASKQIDEYWAKGFER